MVLVTCSLLARPFPTTACLMRSGAYSKTGRSRAWWRRWQHRVLRPLLGRFEILDVDGLLNGDVADGRLTVWRRVRAISARQSAWENLG